MGITRQLIVNNWLHFDLLKIAEEVLTQLLHSTLLEIWPWQLFTKLCESQAVKMTIFLVDLEFREKIKHYLRPKEILFVVFFLFFALIPWVDVFNFVYTNMGGNATKFWEDLDVEVHCNPKFGKLCHQP